MRRVAAFLVRNWPLKLGAIVLATALYGGLVLGQNIRTWDGTLPVDVLRQPAGATLIADVKPVTRVRYRAPLDVGVVSPASFSATIDLSRVPVTPGGESQTVPVTVIALDSRITIVDFEPRELTVQLDPVATRDFPVTVTLGTVPPGLNVGPPQSDPSTVTVRGASSRVDQITEVVARVPIDASALNVDRDVDLIAVDSNGNQVPNVTIDPQRARVRVAVATELANRTLPVVPDITGQPATGYRVTAVTVTPVVVTVSGESATVTQMETAMTEPIDINGRTSDLEATVSVVVPNGVNVTGTDTVRVMISIAQETGTRTFVAGLRVTGTTCACIYHFDNTAFSITLGGPVTDLQALDVLQLSAEADVTALSPGTQTLTVGFTPPSGLDLVSIDPPQVQVTVESATPQPGST